MSGWKSFRFWRYQNIRTDYTINNACPTMYINAVHNNGVFNFRAVNFHIIANRCKWRNITFSDYAIFPNYNRPANHAFAQYFRIFTHLNTSLYYNFFIYCYINRQDIFIFSARDGPALGWDF